MHPNGFLVFLPPSELDDSDEYQDSDPYSVEERFETGFHQMRTDCTLELMRPVIDQQARTVRVLDLGCGQGHITARMLEAFPTAEISAVDYSISAIDYAIRTFPGIDFIVASAYRLPYVPGYFDMVVCNNIWEHVPDPLALLGAIKKVIKPGGHLVISTPSRYRIWNLLRVVRGKAATLMSNLHVTEYSVGQVKEQLRFSGFEVTEVLSRPTTDRSKAFKEHLVNYLLLPAGRAILRRIKSHHVLDSTVLFLAREIPNEGSSACVSAADECLCNV
jgi:2-polyprenyl-3-methyl-5-hydroxy-6-metoxy-1,4-benzoquinol methylase